MCLVVASYFRDGYNFLYSKNIPSLSRNLHTEQRNHRPVGGDEKPKGALVITQEYPVTIFLCYESRTFEHICFVCCVCNFNIHSMFNRYIKWKTKYLHIGIYSGNTDFKLERVCLFNFNAVLSWKCY